MNSRKICRVVLRNTKRWAMLSTSPIHLNCRRCMSSAVPERPGRAPNKFVTVTVDGIQYTTDDFSNVTDRVISRLGTNLHLQPGHPLGLLKRRVVDHFYRGFINARGNPLFSVHDSLSPVVTVEQNFDRLLVPADHPSRNPSDSYYLNRKHMLRAHTSAHQWELVRAGLDNFLVVGDVYRRDEIDATHYPVFHQVEGVRLCDVNQLKSRVTIPEHLSIFESGIRTPSKQEVHTAEAVFLVQQEMQSCIEQLSRILFGPDSQCRWVDAYFPFTHPSYELEVFHEGNWLEVLGCGVMEHKLLQSAGAGAKIGWAVGFGLERLAMKLFTIPDIRLFWSRDSGFISQFSEEDLTKPIKYKPISVYPQCYCDVSFWVPSGFVANDFYDLVRTIGGDLVEQVTLVDTFVHAKKKQTSNCFRIVYRHLEKTLTQQEVNVIHRKIEGEVVRQLGVVLRCSGHS